MLSFISELQEKFGRPVTLQRLLLEQPEVRIVLSEPPRFIGTRSVVRWNEWEDSRDSIGVWQSREENSWMPVIRPDLRIGKRDMEERWKCEIQEVVGFAASKSELTQFFSLDEMVRTNSPEMLGEFTEEKLKEHLAHDEIRILHREETDDHFARYAWDGRLFLVNAGGSHHFAAARYIARRIGNTVPLSARFVAYSLDPPAVAALQRDFDIYAIPGTLSLLHKFHEALRAYRATYVWVPLPAPYKEVAIFLPKNDPRSVRVSGELRSASLFDLGNYLAILARRDMSSYFSSLVGE